MNARRLEAWLGSILGVASAASVVLLGLGVLGMGLANVNALDRPFPAFDPARMASDLAALAPAGFLWLGLVAVILTPSVRVIASFVGLAASGERLMAAVALVVLAVICVGALLGAGG